MSGVSIVPQILEWAVSSEPGVGNAATTSKPAGGAGVRHICKSITATFQNQGGAGATASGIVLRDGASGAGTIIWQALMSISAVNGEKHTITLSGLNIVGSANTAMTLEFPAGVANTNQSVAMTGISL